MFESSQYASRSETWRRANEARKLFLVSPELAIKIVPPMIKKLPSRSLECCVLRNVLDRKKRELSFQNRTVIEIDDEIGKAVLGADDSGFLDIVLHDLILPKGRLGFSFASKFIEWLDADNESLFLACCEVTRDDPMHQKLLRNNIANRLAAYESTSLVDTLAVENYYNLDDGGASFSHYTTMFLHSPNKYIVMNAMQSISRMFGSSTFPICIFRDDITSLLRSVDQEIQQEADILREILDIEPDEDTSSRIITEW